LQKNYSVSTGTPELAESCLSSYPEADPWATPPGQLLRCNVATSGLSLKVRSPLPPPIKKTATMGGLGFFSAQNFHSRDGFVTNSGLKAYPALDYPSPPSFAIAVHEHNMCITLEEQ
jgi:hypothetical protein